MLDLNKILEKAYASSFYLWLLNFGLSRMIPFNRPHGFRVVSISKTSIKTKIPYRKLNFNHIRGLHACALATISEFTTGFLLISRIDGKKFRIIMQRIEMDYHYQGKMDAFAEFQITDEWLRDHVTEPLGQKESTVAMCEVKIHDSAGNHLTTGKVYWQIKPWASVRTKVSN